VGVAKTSAATMGGQPALSVRVTVEQQVIRLRIKYLRPNGHADNHVGSFFARTIAAFAVQTASGNVQRVVTQMEQRIQRRITNQPNVAAATSVTARRSAPGNELLAPKGSHAVAAVASFYPNLDAIDEHAEIPTV
jgi:hypothetical protein